MELNTYKGHSPGFTCCLSLLKSQKFKLKKKCVGQLYCNLKNNLNKFRKLEMLIIESNKLLGWSIYGRLAIKILPGLTPTTDMDLRETLRALGIIQLESTHSQ